MKRITRVLSIIPAAVLVLTIVMTVIAAAAEIAPLAVPQSTPKPGEGDYPGSITITSPDDAVSIEGKTFRIYRIFDTAYNASAPAGQQVAYRIYSEDVRAFLKSYFSDKITNANTVTDPELVALIHGLEESGDINQAELQNFAKKLLDVVQKSTTVEYVDAKADDPKSFKVSKLKLGYYLIEDTSADRNSNAPENAKSVIATLELTTTKKDADVTLKLSRPTIEKFFDNNTSIWTDDTKEPNSASIGDTVNYKILAKIPETRGYTTYNYTVQDLLSKGLTMNKNSLNVVIMQKLSDGSYQQWGNALVKNTDYTYEEEDMGDYGLSIKFDFDKIAQYPTDYYIVITYSATLNENAVVGGDGNPNQVQLTYSNNPNDVESKGYTPPQEVVTYTFAIDLTKIVAGAPDYVLAGAKFRLYRTDNNDPDNATKHYVKIDSKGKVNVNGGWTDTVGEASVIVTDSKGKAKITGLEEGTYFLEEIEAPPGYNKLKNVVKIVITPQYNDDDGSLTSLTATVDGSAANILPQGSGINKNSTVAITIENNGGPDLPSTGGMGTTLIYVIGAALALGAGILLVAKKRMSSNKA